MEKYKNREENKALVGKCEGVANMIADMQINTDPNGSWTGVATDNPYEVPIQDVDDL